jgi:hypothetical protein
LILPNEKLAQDVSSYILFLHFIKIAEIRDGNKPQVRFTKGFTNHSGNAPAGANALTQNVMYIARI